MRRMVEARAIIEENRQLKAALQLRERSRDAVAVGRVVGSSFESPRRFAIISVGTSDGVRIGMPVRAPEGLIGRVIDAGSTASRVLLVSDRANIVPARILKGGLPVISTGRGDGTVDIRPLEVGRNPFKLGDVIATSGTGGLYPPLVPIAKVIRLDDDGAIGIPIADHPPIVTANESPYMQATISHRGSLPRDRCQLHPPDPMRELLLEVGCDLQGEARFAAASSASESEQPGSHE